MTAALPWFSRSMTCHRHERHRNQCALSLQLEKTPASHCWEDQEQAVFYLNGKEIMDNKFGTPAPIPFQDWSHPIPNQMTGTMNPLRVEVKCFGKYTFKIADPAVFMSKVAGTADVFRKDEIVDQMRSEVIGSFQNVLNELGNSVYKTPVLELPSNTDEIKQVMDEKVFDEPIRNRGIKLLGFAVGGLLGDWN